VKRKTIFTAMLVALLAITLLGCGGSNKLQTITLTIGGQGGTFNLQGIGGTLQLKAVGNYSSTKTHDLTNVVTYTVIVDPANGVDTYGNALLPPPQTVTLSNTGLLTAVEPAVCTWVDPSPDPDKPSWFISGDYQITATFDGVTSQPVFVAVASAAGNPSFDGVTVNNPQELCGPN